MTEEQKAAYVIAQSACAMILALGMEAENKHREHRGEAMAYGYSAFNALLEEYGIHHNAVLERFHQP